MKGEKIIKKMRAAVLFWGVALILSLFAGCSGSADIPPSSDISDKPAVSSPEAGKEEAVLKVSATFYPLAEFARQVGGSLVAVSTIIPAGTEPHDYEPTPHEIAGINDSSVFIFNGGALDAWAGKVARDLPSSVRAIEMAASLGIDSQDPHFWLDPVIAVKEVEVIRDAFSAADGANAQSYAKNADAYISKLKALDKDFSEGLLSCSPREIYTSHAAFSYLAERYGLTQVSIAGLSPEAEPSARELANLADRAKANDIRYIFFETLASPKLADTLSTEIGAQTLVLNPLEGLTADEAKSGMDYISVMRQNLSNLKTALECQ